MRAVFPGQELAQRLKVTHSFGVLLDTPQGQETGPIRAKNKSAAAAPKRLVRATPVDYGNQQALSHSIDGTTPHDFVEKESADPGRKTNRIMQGNKQ
jgi:hypothetical protein